VKTSPFFKNLYSLYDAEIDDLSTDSSGANVLNTRLNQKRKQLAQLLPMLAFSPEMVVPAFHGAFRFKAARVMESTVAAHEDRLPDWATVSAALTLADWAEPLVATVLASEGGDAFLVQAAGLEYLMTHHVNSAAPVASESESDDDGENHSDGSGESAEDGDLAEAGDAWMAEQGFDRLG
jgi:hypothetical protein